MNTTPLVLLHGYPFDHTLWAKVRVHFSDDVIAPNLRGFGGTPAGNNPASLGLMADDIARHLDEQKMPRVETQRR